VIALLAAVKFGLHLVVSIVTPYELHRDELLYLAMGRHLRLWTMDFPPGIAVLAELVRGVLGDSLVAIRLGPALAGTAVLIIAAVLARELGGGWRAQTLAALCMLTSPLFLRTGTLFQPVVLDQLAWTLALYALVRLSGGYGPASWLVLGVALGLGLLVKFSIGVIGVAITAGILATRLRHALRTGWPWAALALALAIGSPSLMGQIRLGFPVVDQLTDLGATQLERVTPDEFLLGQLLWGPSTLLAFAGLLGLLASRRLEEFRAAGWTCLTALLLLLVLHGKPYYIGPIYPLLFAAGAVQVEALGESPAAEFVNWGTVSVLVAFGIVTAPLGVPILAPPVMAGYVRALGLIPALRTNTGETERLPQDYADMLGWKEEVAAVAQVYHAMPVADRRRAVLIAGNYGEAGALEFYGPRYQLPPPVSPAGSFWFFGPGDKSGEIAITIGVGPARLARYFDELRPVGRITHPWAVAEERELTLYRASRPRQTLQEIWPSLAGRH